MMKEYERQAYNLGPPLPCPPLRPQQGPFLLPGIRPNSWYIVMPKISHISVCDINQEAF